MEDKQTPTRSRNPSVHLSPQRLMRQEPTPQYVDPSPLRKDIVYSTIPSAPIDLNRKLFDEETSQADFLQMVYSKRHVKSPVVERINVDLDFQAPENLPNITGSNLLQRKKEILMAIFVEPNDNLSLVKLFENLKTPNGNNDFDVEMRVDDKSSTPLHWAAGCGRLALVHALLATGANPTTFAYGGETPLMRAVYTSHNYKYRTFLPLLQLLSASVYSRDCHSRTILHHIAILSQIRSKREISSYYFTAIAEYFANARRISLKAIKVLDPEDKVTEKRFSEFIDAQDEFKETALHIACRYKNYRIVDILLRLGASTQIPNNAGETFQCMTMNSIRFQRLLKRKLLVFFLITFYRLIEENSFNLYAILMIMMMP